MIPIINSAIKDILVNNGITHNAVVNIDSCFDELLEPFSVLSSEHRRFKAFTETGYFIESMNHIIGQRIDEKSHGGNIVKKIMLVFAKFIPMRVVLQKIFNLPYVYSSVSSYVNTLLKENNIIENFVQGDLWRKKIKLYFQGKVVFPLFIYYNDFEVNNVLGTHTGIQKLGGVYYSVECFPPEINSLLENIFLALLFHSSDRIQCNNYSIFSILIDELNYLQTEGIEIEPNKGEKIRIYFALGLLLGDNLGLNGILGFVESFNAYYPCRLCKTSKEQWQVEFFEKRMRVTTYESDVLLGNVTKTGIKERSIWDQVLYFKTSENFVADWLHDGLEGWFKFVLQCILHYYVTKKPGIVSIDILNDRLKTFDYHHNNISNKPPLISYDEIKKKKFSMSGSESSNFILMFAMLIGDLIPDNDKVWPLYLKMREIMDLVLAPKLQKETCNLFRVLISEFHTMFAKLFPNERFTPKSHNFVHYGTIFQSSGPIRNLSTIRFEAKHKIKKKEANVTTSRKNIIHTLCIKEQLSLCYRLMSLKDLESNNSYGDNEYVEDISLCHNYPLFKLTLPSDFNGACLKMKWVKIQGQTYREKTCVVIRCTEHYYGSLPVFGLITSILRNEKDRICLICQILLTSSFDTNLHAYVVQKSEQIKCVIVDDLLSPFPAIFVSLGKDLAQQKLYVTLRHAL